MNRLETLISENRPALVISVRTPSSGVIEARA
jgi:hypothetical protein